MSTSATAPASSAVERVAARVRQANEERRPLRITGAGTWASAPPADATTELPTLELDQVVEYVPGDLTITVGAGMSLSAIEKLTAANGQWLTLDPHGSASGTIGATVATASSGPLATGFGTPRDIVIGLEAVTGTGSVVRAGGRVVKNVAGFDITRLLTGSRGTIGAITELSLRLRARPVVDETLAITLESKASAIRDAIAIVRGWTAMPMAAELLSPSAATALGLPDLTTLLVRFGGNTHLVAAMKKRAAAIAKATVLEPEIWTRLRALDLDAPVSFRVIDLPTSFADRWEDSRALGGGGRFIGSPLRGEIRCQLPAVDRATMTAFRARVKTAGIVFDALPSVALWNSLTSVPQESTLHARVMEAFDPVGVMNPGAMRLAR